MARRRGTRGRGGKGRVMDVRVVETDEGNRAAKVERMLTAYKESQGFTRIVVKSAIFLNTQTSTTYAQYNFSTIRGADEFVALASQYNTYKVSGIRFDVYDQAPSVASNSVFGTYHVGDGFDDPPGTFAQVVDLPDSKQIPPGTGKVSFYWYPSGPSEESFTSTTGNSVDYGGLAVVLPNVATSTAKYAIIFSAIVDFRARV